MRAHRYGAVLVAILAELALAQVAFAGDLKIVDELGLVRAVKHVSAPVTVRVIAGAGSTGPVKPKLVNVDGLSGDLLGEVQAPGTFVFSKVPEGTWRVSLEGGHAQVAEVKIAQ
ncbi:MAG: hypothetical protein K1X79_05120 [Oligoflexia bacterium]|nr:hypothetical protein [Oligoflexia bacterium]